MTLVQSQRKENQIISEYKQGEIYKWHFLFQLPLNLGCRRMKPEPLFPGGLGTTCPQWGFGILSHKNNVSATGIQWELECSRRVLFSHNMFELILQRQDRFHGPGEGLFSSSERGLEGERVSLFF